MGTAEIIIVVAVLLGIVGAGIFFLVRYLKKKKEEEDKYDYTTKYGTRIMLSPQTKGIFIDNFNIWSDSVIDFWFEKKGWDREAGYEKLSQIEIEIYDAEYLERSGVKVNGVIWPNSLLMEISTFPKGEVVASFSRVASLFRHETSHVIAEHVGNLDPGLGGEYHHKLFAEVGLGA